MTRRAFPRRSASCANTSTIAAGAKTGSTTACRNCSGRLRAAGYTLAVATSKPVVFARRILDHFDLARHFAFTGGAELDGRRQAKAEVIAHVMRELRIADAASCLMIGDRRHDIAGAAAVGMDSCGVLWGYGSREELAEAGATRIVAGLDALERLLTGA